MAPPYWRDSVAGFGFSPKQKDRAALLQHDAEALSDRLPPLLVEAERIANTVAQGIHGRRRAGPGETFWQFRHHVEGDTAASIDWRQSAKTQSYYIRENEWEVAESVWIWCDTSPSMDYSYTEEYPTKEYRAIVLALALGHMLLRAGERVGVLGERAAPFMGISAFPRLGAALLMSTFGRDGLPPPVHLPRHARIVLISDFLVASDQLFPRLESLANDNVRGHLLQVLDPAEEEFPFEGRTLFEGLEDKLELVIGRAETLKGAYQAKLGDLKSALGHWARRSDWTFASHRTDRPPHLTLLQFFNSLGAPAEHHFPIGGGS